MRRAPYWLQRLSAGGKARSVAPNCLYHQPSRPHFWIYEVVYHLRIGLDDPSPFRKFLNDGPPLFYELIESVAILGHMGSCWPYQTANTEARVANDINAYADILMDLEDSL